MSNVDTTKQFGVNQGAHMGKKFLFLIRHLLTRKLVGWLVLLLDFVYTCTPFIVFIWYFPHLKNGRGHLFYQTLPPLHRTFIIFQVYQYFTTGGTNYHFKCVKIPGTTPYWKAWLPILEIYFVFIIRILLSVYVRYKWKPKQHKENITAGLYRLFLWVCRCINLTVSPTNWINSEVYMIHLIHIFLHKSNSNNVFL